MYIYFVASLLLAMHSKALPISINIREEEPSAHRTTYDIVWSCFVTIFACVWTSAHPNIPSPHDSGRKRFTRRITMMVYALVAPEMIAFWAWRQYRGAQWIADDYNETFALCEGQATEDPVAKRSKWRKYLIHWPIRIAKFVPGLVRDWWTSPPEDASDRLPRRQWSISHGFFIQMGGLTLYNEGKAKQVLDYDTFKRLLKADAIDEPIILESDIHDRGKADTLGKIFVVVQTTWFVVQCIARFAQHLPICQLEVATLGFAALNAMIYVIWWNKPQGASTSVCVAFKWGRNMTLDVDKARGSVHPTKSTGWLQRQMAKTSKTKLLLPLYWLIRTMQFSLRPFGKMAHSHIVPIKALRVPMFYAYPGPERTSDQDPRYSYAISYLVKALSSLPFVRERPPVAPSILLFPTMRMESTTVQAVFSHLESYAPPNASESYPRSGGQDDGDIQPLPTMPDAFVGPTRILQDSLRLYPEASAYITSCTIGVLFGMVHLVGWSDSSVTVRERLLWRISAVLITVEPIALLVGWAPFMLIGDYMRSQQFRDEPRTVRKVYRFLHKSIPIVAGLPGYIVARLLLLGLALISLRRLTPELHTAISWTTFIPHI